jgi:hypothetical protein
MRKETSGAVLGTRSYLAPGRLENLSSETGFQSRA